VCFQLQREFRAAGFDDAAVRQHVDHVGRDVVEQALVVGDDQEGAVGRTQCVDAFGDVLQRVDVEAAVGFVEDRELGFEQGELEDLVALLLASR
jgi:hypothetical protein